MRIYIFFLILHWVFGGALNTLVAQNCNTLDISTNPDDPNLDPNCPEVEIFDWRQEFIPVDPVDYGKSQIKSPFYNDQNGDLSQLWDENTYGPKGFEYEEGW